MFKRVLILLAVLLIGASALFGAGAAEDDGTTSIAFVGFSSTNEFWLTLARSADARATALELGLVESSLSGAELRTIFPRKALYQNDDFQGRRRVRTVSACRVPSDHPRADRSARVGYDGQS